MAWPTVCKCTDVGPFRIPSWLQAASHDAGNWYQRKIRSARFLCLDAERFEGGIRESRISAEVPKSWVGQM